MTLLIKQTENGEFTITNPLTKGARLDYKEMNKELVRRLGELAELQKYPDPKEKTIRTLSFDLIELNAENFKLKGLLQRTKTHWASFFFQEALKADLKKIDSSLK